MTYPDLSLAPPPTSKPWSWRAVAGQKGTFSLRAEDELLGGLRFESAGVSGQRATADVASARWTFMRVGFLQRHVTVRVPGASGNRAVLTSGLTRRRLFIKSPPQRFVLLESLERTWVDGAGRELMSLAHGHGDELARVTVTPEGATAGPALPLLATLGFFTLALAELKERRAQWLDLLDLLD